MAADSRRDTGRRFLESVPLWRALLETMLLSTLLLALFLLLRGQVEDAAFGQGMFFLVPLASFWFALRVRLPRGAWYRHAIIELGLAAFVSAALGAAWLGLMHVSGNGDAPAIRVLGVAPVSFYVLFSGPYFLLVRAAIRVLLLWQRMRRRRLLWAMTHTQLQVVLLLMAFFGVILGVAALGPRSRGGWDVLFYTFLPFVGAMMALALVAVLGVLPLAAAASFLSARRTTARLEDLARAAEALREGDYATRVEVSGEDEVAQLQTDFNAMASELQRAMADLHAERDKVAGLLEARKELVASVSHELRTPVATLRAFLEPLPEREGLPDDLRRDLAVMEDEIKRLQRLIDDLFTLARAEVSGLSTELAPVDVLQVVRQQVESMAPIAWRSGRVEVVAELPDALEAAMADRGRLAQVLANLLRNAVRHTPPGGIVAALAAPEAEVIRIEVRDTGEGIPPDELASIWDRFYRGDSARAQDHRGAGLGLALVKELVEAMGGAVDVHSVLGGGSCFTVRLPKA